MGYGLALQAGCLEGFDFLGLHQFIRSVAQSGSAPGLGPGGPRFESLYSDQFYLSKALSGCVHGLGPCGQGSNPCRETNLCSSISKARIPVL